MYSRFIACALASTFVFSAFAQDETRPVLFNNIDIPRLSGDVIIDGHGDEAQWRQASLVTLNNVTSPSENTQAPVTTQVRVFEDGEVLYLWFIAHDPEPENIRGHFRDRDQIWNNDLVGVKLDTYNDSRLAYQFFVNPLGIQSDAIQNEMTKRESDSWDAIWQSKGRLTEQGYEVEMAIPLRILNFSENAQVQTWGIELLRFYPRSERIRISNLHYDRDNACNLCQMGQAQGFAGVKQGKNLAIVPTLVLGKGRSRSPSESLEWTDSNNEELGLDVKWGITPEISLQATLNPDFSQVESDVAQLSINNTFALFFNEKRPFFLENADYFSSDFNLVYTRNIASPDYGAKVTGRKDAHTFGLFIANDENTTFLVPGNVGSSIAQLEQESTNLALRYRFDVSDDLYVGFTSTLRDADGYHNYVYGIDSKYNITEQDTVKVQILRSETLYPTNLFKGFCNDGECADENQFSEAARRLQKDQAFTGNGYRIGYKHEERDWWFRTFNQSRNEDLRTDLGFGSRADHRQSVLGGGYNWFSENTWWNRITLLGDWDIAHNDNGELIEKESEVFLNISGQYQSRLEFGVVDRFRVGPRYNSSDTAIANNTTLYNERQYIAFASVRPIADLSMHAFVRLGDEIDFDNNRLGEITVFRPSLNLNVGQHLQLNLRHTYSQMDVDEHPLFTANLTDFRATYQFDQRQLLRLIVIYSDIERNPQNYNFAVDEHYQSVGTQLLYSYKVNPLTKFFVGYSDSAYQDDQLSAITPNEQSIFMKLSYAWLN